MKIYLNTSSIKWLFVLLFVVNISCNHTIEFKNTNLSFEERARALVAEMTLEEKISQLSYNSPAIERLQIPEYNWWNECLHGVGRAGIATVFPQAIGMAAMWDDSAMFEIANIISDEARAKYHDYIKKGQRGIYQGLTFWTPNINIFRDPRWGRGMETYGEDPFLTGQLGVAFIKGLQGNHPKYYKLIATAKHFAVHSGPEADRHRFNAAPSEYDFLETYSPQFKMAVQEGKVHSIMCAYNSYKGKPCCGNIELSNLLRKDWGFNGYIVSDCGAIKDFYHPKAHEVVNTKAEAAAIAVKAGTDLNCGDSYPALLDAVEKGYVSEKEIDIVVKRLFVARMKLGMFDADEDNPFSKIPYKVVDSEKHKKAALDAARKSIVLLKNGNSILPFSKDIKKVAVIGPNSNDIDILLGNYNGFPSEPITPYAGIKQKLKNAEVSYQPGCCLAKGLPLLSAIPENVFYTDSTKSAKGLKAEYFNNKELKGKPAFIRTDKKIDFKWWTAGPGNTINGKEFSVRWQGVIVPEKTGKYAIGIESYPELKLWINGKEFIKYNSVHRPQKKYELIELEANKSYSFKLEYIQDQAKYANVSLLWEAPGKRLKEDAVKLAQSADLVVLCMGLSPLLEGEEMEVKVDGFSNGDRDDIKLPKTQTELIKAIHQLNIPTVLVLLNGSALAFNWEAENIPAIIEAWYPGQAGGKAIADVIFGDYNPAGRLPVTFYKSVEQLPLFDDYSMDGRTYRYFEEEPLYGFGFGLSYTQFKYDQLALPDEIIAGDDFSLSVMVTNIGKMDGDEVVQLYISHPDSKLKVPIRTLKAFKRIYLKAGESQKVTFTIQPEDIAVLNTENRYVVENKHVVFSIGGKQPDEESIKKQEVVIEKVPVKVNKGEFYAIN
jgi:beta-glucosidase